MEKQLLLEQLPMFEQNLLMTYQPAGVNGSRKQMKRKDNEPRSPSTAMGNPLTETLVARAETKQTYPTNTAAAEDTFVVVDAMVQHAIQDAMQTAEPSLRWEALAWLQVCCPDIADQLSLPWPEVTDIAQKAAAYLDRYPAY